MTSRLVLLVLVLCTSPALWGQSETPARYQVYGGYSWLSNSFNGVPGARQTLNGWDGSLVFPSWHNLRFKVATFGYRGSNTGASQNSFFIVGGVEYSRRVGRESVFVEGMGGDGGLGRYWGPSKAPGETASFASVLGGGIDTPLSRRFRLRVSGDYVYAHFVLINNVELIEPVNTPGLPNNFARISTGFVWNF